MPSFELGFAPVGEILDRKAPMSKTISRSALRLGAAMVTALAIAAPAQASVTPVSTRASFTSTNTVLVIPSIGQTISCPTVELTGTTDSRGSSAVGRITFSGNTAARTTCTNNIAQSFAVSCQGFVAVQDTTATSVRGVNTSLDFVLLGGPACVSTNQVTRAAVNADPQTVRSCVTLRENTTVDLNCALTLTIPGVGSFTGTLTGTFNTATNISLS